jgi:hypothetical protein
MPHVTIPTLQGQVSQSGPGQYDLASFMWILASSDGHDIYKTKNQQPIFDTPFPTICILAAVFFKLEQRDAAGYSMRQRLPVQPGNRFYK